MAALFLGQIRNFHINMKQTKPGLAFSAIRWRGGKGSNLYNVDITANKASTTQRGVCKSYSSTSVRAQRLTSNRQHLTTPVAAYLPQ